MSDFTVSHVVVGRESDPGAVRLDEAAALRVRSQLVYIRRPSRVNCVELVLVLVLPETVENTNNTRLSCWKHLEKERKEEGKVSESVKKFETSKTKKKKKKKKKMIFKSKKKKKEKKRKDEKLSLSFSLFLSLSLSQC